MKTPFELSYIRVLAHDLRRRELAGTIIDRPFGSGSFSLIRFHSPMAVHTSQGMMSARAGNCILFVPGYQHYYWGTEGDWINDWMHLEGDEVIGAAQRYRIPLNKLLMPSNTCFWPKIFEEIAYEKHHQNTSWEESVDLLMRQFFLKLGRELTNSVVLLTPTETEHLKALRIHRQQLFADLSRAWTINQMADEVGLSASRYAALYQRFFGISPIEDLLRARIQHAQYLLTNRVILVHDVAKQCGFKNVNYFSTVFHRRVGCPPRDYHQHAVLQKQAISIQASGDSL